MMKHGRLSGLTVDDSGDDGNISPSLADITTDENMKLQLQNIRNRQKRQENKSISHRLHQMANPEEAHLLLVKKLEPSTQSIEITIDECEVGDDTDATGKGEAALDLDKNANASLRGRESNSASDKALTKMNNMIENAHNMTEIIEFAKYLGIDPSNESSLLWIAQEAIQAPLPAGWSDHTDDNGNVYFYNSKNKGIYLDTPPR